MANYSERQTISFVVRLWHEPGEGAAPWRVQIEHVGTGDTAHFQFSTGLWEFLAQHVEFLPQAPTDERLTGGTENL